MTRRAPDHQERPRQDLPQGVRTGRPHGGIGLALRSAGGLLGAMLAGCVAVGSGQHERFCCAGRRLERMSATSAVPCDGRQFGGTAASRFIDARVRPSDLAPEVAGPQECRALTGETKLVGCSPDTVTFLQYIGSHPALYGGLCRDLCVQYHHPSIFVSHGRSRDTRQTAQETRRCGRSRSSRARFWRCDRLFRLRRWSLRENLRHHPFRRNLLQPHLGRPSVAIPRCRRSPAAG